MKNDSPECESCAHFEEPNCLTCEKCWHFSNWKSPDDDDYYTDFDEEDWDDDEDDGNSGLAD